MSNSGILALHVPVNGTGVTLVRTSTELRALQALVGGDLEEVAINEYASAYVNEEGRLQVGAQPNQVLNAVLRMLGAPISPVARVGDAVIFGPFTDDGDEQDVDPRVVSLVQSLGFPVSNQPSNNEEKA